MSTVPVPRWAVSFADLVLLLLGCFVLLHAIESARPRADSRAVTAPAPRGRSYDAATLFQRGEAVLRPDARLRLQTEGRRLAGRRIEIVSRGGAESGGRLDRFELSAARVAAVGRALQEGGLGQGAIAISASAGGGEGQSIAIVAR